MAQLCILPPGERHAPFPPPDLSAPTIPLTSHPHSNARMSACAGVLYLAPLHGKRFPEDLTPLDLDRLAAHGLMMPPQPWPDFAAPLREMATDLAPLLFARLPCTWGVRVSVCGDGLSVTVLCPGCPLLTVEVSPSMCDEYAHRLPSLCGLIVRAVRQRRRF